MMSFICFCRNKRTHRCPRNSENLGGRQRFVSPWRQWGSCSPCQAEVKKCSRRQRLLPEVPAPRLRVSRPYHPREPCPAVPFLKAETKLVSVQSTAALLSLGQCHKDAAAETILSALRRCSRRLNSCWSDMWPQAFANFWAVHPDQHQEHIDGGNGLS
jgi:hypothetical protein